jgi:hypothetical protein
LAGKKHLKSVNYGRKSFIGLAPGMKMASLDSTTLDGKIYVAVQLAPYVTQNKFANLNATKTWTELIKLEQQSIMKCSKLACLSHLRPSLG